MFQIKWILFKDRIEEIKRYYKWPKFAVLDLCLFALYLFSNPYRLCRKFLQSKGEENVYTYGEIPLASLEKMVKTFAIGPEERWLELGSGRGRACFWISLVWGCQARGVDWVPSFISRAKTLGRLFALSNPAFEEKSIYDADFSWPSVVFLYSTCMSQEEIAKLLIPMQALCPKAKVITISEPLFDSRYSLLESTLVSFPWGKTKAYLHSKLRDCL